MIKNDAKGSVWYALHFYPGLAEYREPGQEPLRICLKEDALRKMDSTFAGCPVFVMHVDEVEQDLDILRAEADGWVTKSFYNAADGNHWVEFIAVSEKAEKAIQNGYAVSNAYIPTVYGGGGEWNGMDYDKEIIDGKFEHLAIVPNPRYAESKILSPEQFKEYNQEKANEIKLSNSKSNGETPMKLSWFERKKVENAPSLESMSVVLPRSGKEVAILRLINEADEEEVKREKGESAKDHDMANGDHHVMVDGHKMKVNDLVAKYKDACAAMHAMKDSEGEEAKDYVEGEGFEEKQHNEEDDEADKEEEMKEEKKKDEKKKNEIEARERADRLRNAKPRQNSHEETATIYLTKDGLARGKVKYG